MAAPISEPLLGANPNPAQPPVMDAYSMAPGDAQNRAAQAGNAAAHHAEAGQAIPQAVPQTKAKGHQTNIAQLVAEENASKSKFPRYPGLERWQLLEKMGDGAFSNVYRARDLEGDAGEVAIKVVRKYEMNNMQVRSYHPVRVTFSRRCTFLAISCCWSHFVPLPTCSVPRRATSICTLTSRRCQRLQRCAPPLFFYSLDFRAGHLKLRDSTISQFLLSILSSRSPRSCCG
jgi:hypothetical protein